MRTSVSVESAEIKRRKFKLRERLTPSKRHKTCEGKTFQVKTEGLIYPLWFLQRHESHLDQYSMNLNKAYLRYIQSVATAPLRVRGRPFEFWEGGRGGRFCHCKNYFCWHAVKDKADLFFSWKAVHDKDLSSMIFSPCFRVLQEEIYFHNLSSSPIPSQYIYRHCTALHCGYLRARVRQGWMASARAAWSLSSN